MSQNASHSGQGTLSIPENRNRLAQRLVLEGDAGNPQHVTLCSHGGGNDCNAVPILSHSHQGMWGTTLKFDVHLDTGKPTGRVKCTAEHEIVVQ